MSHNDLIRRCDAVDAAWEASSLELFTLGPGKIVARINAITAAQPTVKPLGADGVTIHPQDILNAAWRDDLGEEGLAMYARILSALDMQPTVSPELLATTNDVAELPPSIVVRRAVSTEGHIAIRNVDFDDAEVGLCLIPIAHIDGVIAALARVKGETK